MTYQADRPSGTRRRVDPVRLWAGGVATALVAGGIAFVGVLVIRAIFHIPGMHRFGNDYRDIDRLLLAICAAAAALLATALLHLLMISTPRAHKFFAWIVGLVVVGLIVQELIGGNDFPTNVLLSALYLIIGIAIASLLTGVARTAVSYVSYEPRSGYQQQIPGYQEPQQGYRDQTPDYPGQVGRDDQTRRLPPSP